MSTLLKLLLNTVSLALVLVINYLSGTGAIGNTSVGGISRMYPTVITPAGYAFSIWGLIYTLLILFTCIQWYTYIKKDQSLINSIGIYFFLANLANLLWVVIWVNGFIGLSLLMILILLGSLLILMQRLDLERWNAPFTTIVFVWWPISIYLGWVIIASILNFNVFLASAGYNQELLSATILGIILIALGTAVYIYLTYSRNLRETAAVGVWGLIAVTVEQASVNVAITTAAAASASILFAAILYHAYQNTPRAALKEQI